MPNVIADIPALPAQIAFINSTARYPAIIGGYGSGKSAGGLFRAMVLKFRYPKQTVAVYSPSYPLLRDYWFEEIEKFCTLYNMDYYLNKSDKILHIQGHDKILLRSMDDPKSIITYEVAHSIVDELDVFPKDKAKERWDRINARNRQKLPDKKPNTMGLTTTPEGYGFAYSLWGKKKSKDYHRIKARTKDNPFIAEDYYDKLVDSYDSILLEAYTEGNFVNLRTGSVYYGFNPDMHVTDKPNQLKFDPSLPVNLCCDFNVNPMVWELSQSRSRHDIRFITEIKQNNTHTGKMCKALKEILPRHFRVRIYGDAAGTKRDTRGTATDYILIDQELRPFYDRIDYFVPDANPAVSTRTKAVNSRLDHGAVVIDASCNELIEDFIQCGWKDYDIDKSDPERTHASDAAGYYVNVEFPILIKRKLPEVRTR